jgi:hypothetical protein
MRRTGRFTLTRFVVVYVLLAATAACLQLLLRAGEPGWLLFRLIFAVSVAILVVCLLILLAGRVRARVRRTYNHCPVCGYDIHASPDRCPECGTPINEPAT